MHSALMDHFKNKGTEVPKNIFICHKILSDNNLIEKLEKIVETRDQDLDSTIESLTPFMILLSEKKDSYESRYFSQCEFENNFSEMNSSDSLTKDDERIYLESADVFQQEMFDASTSLTKSYSYSKKERGNYKGLTMKEKYYWKNLHSKTSDFKMILKTIEDKRKRRQVRDLFSKIEKGEEIRNPGGQIEDPDKEKKVMGKAIEFFKYFHKRPSLRALENYLFDGKEIFKSNGAKSSFINRLIKCLADETGNSIQLIQDNRMGFKETMSNLEIMQRSLQINSQYLPF